MLRSCSMRNTAGCAMFQASSRSRCQTPYARTTSRRSSMQDVEGETCLFDVAAHGVRALREDRR